MNNNYMDFANVSALISSLDNEVSRRSNLLKKAADGRNSAMPDDPSDHTGIEPSTGAFYNELDKDLKATGESTVAATPNASLKADGQGNTLLQEGTDLGSIDTMDVDKASMTAEDPGTEFEASTDNNDKYASYSLDENYKQIEKISSYIMSTIGGQPSRQQVSKQAAYQYGYQPTQQEIINLRMQKLAEVCGEAENDADRVADSVLDLMGDSDSSACEGESCDPETGEGCGGDPADLVETVDELSPEDQAIVLELIKAVDEGAISEEEAREIADAAPEDTEAPEEKAAMCRNIFLSVKRARYENGLRKAAAWVVKAAEDLEEADAEALGDMSDADLDQVIENSDAAAEGMDALDEANPEDVADLESLPPEAQEAVLSLIEATENGDIAPEELAELAAEAEDAEIGQALEDSPEASEGEGDDAVAALSEAMAEEGVTPTDLAAVTGDPEKQAFCRTMANTVANYRNGQRKTAGNTGLGLKKQCHALLREMMN